MKKKTLVKIILGASILVLTSAIVVLAVLLVNERKKEEPKINNEIFTYAGITPDYLSEIIVSDSNGVIDKRNLVIEIDDSKVNYDVVGRYLVSVKITYMKKTYNHSVYTEVLSKAPVIDKRIIFISIGDENIVLSKLVDVKDYLGNKISNISVDDSKVNYIKEGKYVIVVTATDNEGNIATQNIELRVSDLRPVLELKKDLSLPIVYEIGNDFNILNYLSARDKSGNDISFTIKFLNTKVLFNTLGTYNAKVGCIDKDGRRNSLEIQIKVVPKKEDQRPVLNGIKENIMVFVNGYLSDEELLDGVTAYDAYGDLTSEIVLHKEEVDFTKPGIYQIYYKVTNSLENPNEFTTTGITMVKVIENDHEGPVLEFDSDPLYVEVNTIPNLLEGVTCYDLVDEDVSIDSIEIKPNDIDYSVLGEYRLKYSVNDKFGNNTYKFRDLIIRDTTKPVINGLDDIITTTKSSEWNYDVLKSGVTINDNYDGDITETLEILYGETNILNSWEAANGIFTNIGEYRLVYKVTDSSGNETIKEITLIVT